MALDAVQRHVSAIGEAVKALSADLRERHRDVPWSEIARIRDLIGHH
ncbi:MAG TPA: HepT-like ribonuclease domain-containing protein [Cellulomonadaceae bacterium]|nr:HepT-like ribonuclease domain-containing protein [Cellulomonadaceae bacterium]